ncbi:3-phosphoserine/phosphohydroxythreonine transaminase [Sediminibacterium roseum]|uniref:Phosphoserine aminotransferase n=1 Tax=Sediminibacterium roseum TaxID=1978412 RepID=A0ABW9ZXV8_9BACT|nr:3-phosphoserine/phosphohydroxythreonine transaminase [Sediminibacterium roseum]NCI51879.1 3-phosphoserine/phosphohydroxythreonine transaminase [Sediminibacterium roseum]
MSVHNFNSGPSILPKTVMEEASRAIIDFNGTGLSVLEIGHRTPLFQDVLQEAIGSVKKLMELDDAYEVLFLHGGATTQFMQVPMNLLDNNETAAYCDNGIWGKKAAKEASLFGNVNVVADTSDRSHTYIKKDFAVPADAKYLHITTNNTVEGTQWHQYPEVAVPLIGDMSSDIFSRPADFKKFSLIYAGAQKNMGAAGVNMVVVKKDILGTIKRSIPTIMDYRKHIEAGSLMNTPPVFAVYVSMLTLRWIIAEGGLKEMEQRSNAKSALLYNTIDSLPVFTSRIAKEDRSQTNAVFFLSDPQLEAPFLDLCKKEGMVGVKGYRTIGGVRVSMYNALPISSVQAFCDLMKEFATKNG